MYSLQVRLSVISDVRTGSYQLVRHRTCSTCVSYDNAKDGAVDVAETRSPEKNGSPTMEPSPAVWLLPS
ncbi:hypothetical protein BDD12DRAFT_839271 [Trichophaea hybrida]|nr:hypothetical protein BDD12DRAFT_839271 [Trichophaea hybrida]